MVPVDKSDVKAQAREIYRRNFSKFVLISFLVLIAGIVSNYFLSGYTEGSLDILYNAIDRGQLSDFYTTLGPVLDQLMFSSLISAAVMFLITGPLTIGQYELFLSAINGDDTTSVGDIFSWFSSARRLLKAAGLSFTVFLIGFLWGFLFIFVASFVSMFLQLLLGTVGMLLGFVLVFGAVVLLVARLLTLSPSQYILAANDGAAVFFAIRESMRICKPYRWDMLKLVLSFFVLYIPSIALAFLSPYIGLLLSSILSNAYSIVLAPYFALSLMIYFKRIAPYALERPGQSTIDINVDDRFH